MRKSILLSILGIFLISLQVFSQHLHDDHELYCSKARFYKEYFKNSKDVVQTPLLHNYDVKHYYLDIEVDNSSTYVAGEVTFYSEVVTEVLDTFAFELLDGMNINDVLINNESLSYLFENSECFVPLNVPLAEGEMFTAKISYDGTPPSGGFFSGISNSNDWNKDVTWTLSEPFAARDWWPTKQVLEDKADSVWVFLTTANTNMAGSNGLLTNVVNLPDNKVRYEWKSNYPIAYYLISFAVSEYQEYNIYAHPQEMNGDSVLIQNFIYDSPGCLENYQTGIDQTAEFIELFSDLITLYPFHEEKYGHCLTALGGGMEHQTMTTIGGFSFGLVAHELGHMWFGDNITCATWSDIWINEGFATYMDYLANEYILGQSAANAKMNSIHNSVKSQPDGSVYVPTDEVTYDNVWRIFDGRLSYNKGAAIIHMIRFELQDDDLFFQVLKDYQEIYTDSTATGLDFMNVLNETSGMDFTQFFDQWYFGEGYPTFSIDYSQDEGYTYFEITQNVSAPSVTPVFKMLMEYKLLFYDGTDTTIQLVQTDNVNTFMLPITKDIGLIQIDPSNWVINSAGAITTNVYDEFNPARFHMGPNPALDILNINFIQSETGDKIITIFDLKGNEVLTFGTSEIFNPIDVSGIAPGTYFILAESGNETYSKKFIKVN
ncbi:MAG: T9SS type A sorting domain-containing protein [Bacteroidales bacterium]|nr:T9SS type A sorting domain-containing protein [Bacteroidales bacterium]MCF8403488.1 T9SS type A sorting domain-containing protein [Bacteroidales bacterium]